MSIERTSRKRSASPCEQVCSQKKQKSDSVAEGELLAEQRETGEKLGAGGQLEAEGNLEVREQPEAEERPEVLPEEITAKVPIEKSAKPLHSATVVTISESQYRGVEQTRVIVATALADLVEMDKRALESGKAE